MKKKLVLALVCIAMSLCLLLTACDTSPEKIILDQVSAQAAAAKKIKATITVKDSSNLLIGTETVVYDIETGKKAVTKRVPNTDFSQESAWVETTKTVVFNSSEVKFAWQKESFSSLTLNGLVLNGTIDKEAINGSLGIDATSVMSNVNVVISASGSLESGFKVSNVTLSYTSSNNNAVSIVITMA